MRALLLFLLLASPCSAQGPPPLVPPIVAAPLIQGNCYPYDALEATLWSWGETSVGRIRIANGSALEVFIAAKTGTLTTIEIKPNGFACYRGIGDGWGSPAKNMSPV